jgi:hypothetical protein
MSGRSGYVSILICTWVCAIALPALAQNGQQAASRGAMLSRVLADAAAARAAIKECDYDRWVLLLRDYDRAARAYMNAGGGFSQLPGFPT